MPDENRSPIFGKMESVDTRNRDEHIAAFKAGAQARRDTSGWVGKRKRPPCPPAVDRAPERQEIEELPPHT
jgi:hypothetical protein